MRLSRAIIAAMSTADVEAADDEIRRWMAAGAVDGADVHPLVRPAGHMFSRAELRSMSDAEFKANETAIDAAMKAGLITGDAA